MGSGIGSAGMLIAGCATGWDEVAARKPSAATNTASRTIIVANLRLSMTCVLTKRVQADGRTANTRGSPVFNSAIEYQYEGCQFTVPGAGDKNRTKIGQT